MKKIILSALLLAPSVFAMPETDVQPVIHEPTSLIGHEVSEDQIEDQMDEGELHPGSRWYTDTSTNKLENLFKGGEKWAVNYYTYGPNKLWLNVTFHSPSSVTYSIVDTIAGSTLQSGTVGANISYSNVTYNDRYSSSKLTVREARLKLNANFLSSTRMPEYIVLRSERKFLWTGIRGYGAQGSQTKYTSEFGVFSGHAKP